MRTDKQIADYMKYYAGRGKMFGVAPTEIEPEELEELEEPEEPKQARNAVESILRADMRLCGRQIRQRYAHNVGILVRKLQHCERLHCRRATYKNYYGGTINERSSDYQRHVCESL